MGDFNIQRKGDEVIIRLNISELDKNLLDKLSELLFWEYAFRKAGFNENEIRKIFEEAKARIGETQSTAHTLTDTEIERWTDEIEQKWWNANAEHMLKGVNR